MVHPIETVPALKRLDLLHVGCWEELSMEFQSGLNIITKEGPALGRTTILQAILHALAPSHATRQWLSPTDGFPRGRISLEFLRPSHSVDLLPAFEAAAGPGPEESFGACTLDRLRDALAQAGSDTCLLLEDDALSVLDERSYREAIGFLNAARCQVICLVRRRPDPADFPKARVFAVALGESEKTVMKVLRSGGNAR